MLKVAHCSTHLHLNNAKVRKAYVKAVFAYGGAALMAMDASVAIAGPHLFPHVVEHFELIASNGGKAGAAFAGFAAFFDRIVASAIKEL